MLLDFDILKIISNDVIPKAGRILISEPLLNDIYFKRSVVLISEEYNNSFMGFVLNLKSELFLHDVIDGFNDTNIRIYLGGPVNIDVLYYIHNFDFIKDAYKITDNLFFNGNINEIRDLVNSGYATNKNIKFFLGASGWAPGQLKEEIAYNSWLVGEMPAIYAFAENEKLWDDALNFVDKKYQIWKNFPIDPEFN